MRIVLIGPLPPPVGGATVLFAQLIECLEEESGVEICVVNTARKTKRRATRSLKAMTVAWTLLKVCRAAGVISFHASIRGAVIASPLLRILAFLMNRGFVLRVFGGGLADWYQGAGLVERLAFRFGVLGADVVFLERQALVSRFSGMSKGKVLWMPNSRRLPNSVGESTASKGVVRFVFLAQVRPTKGIYELLEASAHIDHQRCSIDVYGPLQGGVRVQDFSGTYVRYRGEVAPESVLETLKEYDVLVLPTYYEGEGYPGVILEAFAVGLAVVATNWGGIPELIAGNEGILVETRSVEALAAAMISLIDEPDRLMKMKRAARERASFFDAARWASYFVNVCVAVTDGSAVPDRESK